MRSKAEDFVIDAICDAPLSIRLAHGVDKPASIAGADPDGYILVIEIDGEEKVINVTVKEREA